MSIREWAKRILASKDFESKLGMLKEAYLAIHSLPLGPKVPIDWVLPDDLFTIPEVTQPIPEVRMLHSIANIELMAIYLYWDTLSMVQAPNQFYLDMANIAIQECTHFNMLVQRLKDLGYIFPCIPTTNYLFELNNKTKEDIKARIVVVSIYSEGRALDSKERLLRKLKGYNKDLISCIGYCVILYKLLEKIIFDEVEHLKNGVKWFRYFCEKDGIDPKLAHDSIIHKLKLTYRPPFNQELRKQANIPIDWYNNKT
jgi:uncharacterized ferritin-like protein (DUF455 family)